MGLARWPRAKPSHTHTQTDSIVSADQNAESNNKKLKTPHQHKIFNSISTSSVGSIRAQSFLQYNYIIIIRLIQTIIYRLAQNTCWSCERNFTIETLHTTGKIKMLQYEHQKSRRKSAFSLFMQWTMPQLPFTAELHLFNLTNTPKCTSIWPLFDHVILVQLSNNRHFPQKWIPPSSGLEYKKYT